MTSPLPPLPSDPDQLAALARQLSDAQTALRQSEERYRVVSELTSDFTYAVTVSPTGELIAEWITESFERVTGYTLAEVDLRGGLPSIVYPADFASYHERYARLLAGQPDVRESRVVTKSGAVRWLRDYARPEQDATGRVVRIYGAAQDITAHKQVLTAVDERERRFRALIEHSSDGITLFDRHYQVLYRSPVAERVTGYTNAERLGGQVIDLVHPDDYPAVKAAIDAVVLSGGSSPPVLYRNQHHAGAWRWLEAVFTNLLDEPAVEALLANYRDVTERKHADELRAQLAAIVEFSDDAIIGHTLTGLIVNWNAGAERLFGYAAADVLGQSLARLMPPDRPAELPATLEQLWRGQHVQEGDTVRVRRDGSRVAVSISTAPIRDDAGQVIGASAIARDISDRKLREREQVAVVRVSAALRAANTLAEMYPLLLEQLESLLDASGAAVVLVNPDSGEAEVTLARGEWQSGTGRRLRAEQGLSQVVIRSGQPFFSNALTEEARFFGGDLVVNMRAAVCVPLRTQEGVIGALWAGRVAALTPHEVALTVAVADIAAIAIQRATLHEQTQRQLAHVTALHEIDTVIASSLDARLTLGVLLRQALSTLKVDGGAVLLTNARLNTLEFIIGRGLSARSVLHNAVPVGQGYAGRAALERRTLSLPNLAQAEPDPTRVAHLTAEGFQAYVAVPLIAKGVVEGVLEIVHRAPLRLDAEWLDFLEALARQAAIAVENAQLFDELQRSNLQLTLAYDATIEGWSRALDLRDRETEGHTQRVTEHTMQLARAVGLDGEDLVHIRRGALLHDMGKLGVPDQILLKPAPLTDAEWAVMRQHPVYAYDMLAPITYLRPALDIPYCHHEKWNGSGYPRGLAGEQIPLAARLFAIVDVWDALRSDRPYRPGWPAAQVRQHLAALNGSHFEPRLLEAFLTLLDQS